MVYWRLIKSCFTGDWLKIILWEICKTSFYWRVFVWFDQVQAVREVVPGKSNNDIVMVLQYYDCSVERTIQAFLEGRSTSFCVKWKRSTSIFRRLVYIFLCKWKRSTSMFRKFVYIFLCKRKSTYLFKKDCTHLLHPFLKML